MSLLWFRQLHFPLDLYNETRGTPSTMHNMGYSTLMNSEMFESKEGAYSHWSKDATLPFWRLIAKTGTEIMRDKRLQHHYGPASEETAVQI